MTALGIQLKQFATAGLSQDADLIYTSQNGTEAAMTASQLAGYVNAKVNPANLPARNTLTGAEKLAVLQSGSLVEATVDDLTAASAAQFATVMLAWFNSLPTARPATSGVLWNNGGTLAQS